MKRGMHILILLTVAITLPLYAAIEFAQGVLCKETVGGIEWSFVAGDNRAVVGSSQILVSAINLFHGCTSITNIHFPASVTFIGWMTCYPCGSLQSVDLPLNAGRDLCKAHR